MLAWSEFAVADPELAKLGEGLIFQFGVGLAFLATVRKDGGPRLHPVCPIMYQNRLYVMIGPDSPKKCDLLRDGRYALQSFPPPKDDGEEFYITGQVEFLEDPELKTRVMAATKSRVTLEEFLFEFKIERAMYTCYQVSSTGKIGPVHKIWKADKNRG